MPRNLLLTLITISALLGVTYVYAARSTQPAAPKPATNTPVVVVYDNCSAARVAGVAPLHRGDPGYVPKLDRDADGIACE